MAAVTQPIEIIDATGPDPDPAPEAMSDNAGPAVCEPVVTTLTLVGLAGGVGTSTVHRAWNEFEPELMDHGTAVDTALVDTDPYLVLTIRPTEVLIDKVYGLLEHRCVAGLVVCQLTPERLDRPTRMRLHAIAGVVPVGVLPYVRSIDQRGPNPTYTKRLSVFADHLSELTTARKLNKPKEQQ